MWTASTILDEERGRKLADALSDVDGVGSQTIDVNEISPGRWQLVVYFEGEPNRRAVAEIEGIARKLSPSRIAFTISNLPDSDWVAKSLEGLKPVRAGRFVVHGRHDRDVVKPNDIGIEIEAAQAFGTGHHGSTAGCLTEIDRIARTRPIRNALDIGTGSGVLAIATAKVSKASVLASDIDPLAAKIAAENARLNGVAKLVRVIAADGLAKRAFREHAPYDLIVANILAGPLVALAPAIRRRLAPDGTVILSGLLPEQRNRVAAAYRAAGLRVERAETRDGWATLTLILPPRGGRLPRRSAGYSGSSGRDCPDRSAV